MPNLRNTGQRIAQGWITKSALLAGSYLVTGLTVVSDQKTDNQILIPWLAPIHPSQTPQLSDKQTTLSGRVTQYGFRQFQWQMSYLTFGMIGTIKAFYADTNQSQAVTIGTYDDTDTFIAIQCYLAPLNLPGSSGEAEIGGFKNVILEFTGGTIV